jgi:hypothetical protein
MSDRKKLFVMVALALSALAASPAVRADVILSKADPVSAAEQDRARVQSVLDRSEVAEILTARGLSATEIEGRLDQLSPEDLRSLAANVEQVQAAGDVPNYIWILLAILLSLAILAALSGND